MTDLLLLVEVFMKLAIIFSPVIIGLVLFHFYWESRDRD